MANLSARDRDLIIRTVIGEVDPKDPDSGHAAVAHVITNRLASKRFGKTAADVVLQRHAFEPWTSRASELMAIPETSGAYRKTAAIVDAVLSGDLDDPTGGATHFFGPRAQAALGRQPPKWAKGEPMATIGGHVFYAPEGRVDRSGEALEAINAAIGAATGVPGTALPLDAEKPAAAPPAAAGSLFRDAGFAVPTAPAAAPAGAPAQPAAQPAAASPGSIFRDAGFALPTDRPGTAPVGWPGFREVVTPPLSDSDIQYRRFEGPNGVVRLVAPDGTYTDSQVNPQGFGPKSPVQAAKEIVTAIPGDVGRATTEAQRSGVAMAKSGIEDISRGIYYPTMPSADPRTWTGGGFLKTLGGASGAVFAPLTGLAAGGVAAPVTKVTGNPTAGEMAGALTGVMIPVAAPAAAATAARIVAPPLRAVSRAAQVTPADQAISTLVNAIGPENVPAALQRLRANPNLSVMDVSDPVRTLAQGLIDPAQPRAQRVLTEAVRRREDTLPAQVNSAYTAAMGASPHVPTMLQGLRQRVVDVGRQQIEPALATARPVDVGPVVRAIDAELRPGVQAMANPGTAITPTPLQQELARIRQRLTDDRGNVIVDPVRLHGVQSELRERAYQLSTSATGSDRLLGRDIYDFRNRLVDAIDDATKAPGAPAGHGPYRQGLTSYRDARQIDEAFDAGFDTLKNRPGRAGLEDRPDMFAQALADSTPEQLVARRLGTRLDIDQKINGMRFAARRGMEIPEVEYNRQKLELLFGRTEARRLIQSMRDARAQALTNAKLVQGSKTAETLSAKKALNIREVGGGNPLQYVAPIAAEMLGQGAGLPGVGGVGAAVALGAHRGLQKVGQIRDIARNVRIAEAASASGGARTAVIRQLAQHPAVLRASRPGLPNPPRNAISSAIRRLIGP